MNSVFPLPKLLQSVQALTRRNLERCGWIDEIRLESQRLESATGTDLRERVALLRERVAAGLQPTSDAVLIPAFATICEGFRRRMGIELYEVQLQAGRALTRGAIAEMQTGEGKTFVAALPAITQALAGKGVHVMTVNSYLAERDCELLRPLIELLGLEIGLLRRDDAEEVKRRAYAADVTYGPGYEFGFDFLRDQILKKADTQKRLGQSIRESLFGATAVTRSGVQRGHAFAVVDEADSVMIDEATTPLLLADAPRAEQTAVYELAAEVARKLKRGVEYRCEPQSPRLTLTEEGHSVIAEFAEQAACGGLLRPWHRYVEQALCAELVLQQDADYLVQEEQILIVDKDTGRVFEDRSWKEGLHQAVQAKEGVRITGENRSLAQVSYQRFLAMYGGLCGMTGTTTGSEAEFRAAYRLAVRRIPTRLPGRRAMLPTRFFGGTASKDRAIVAEVRLIHTTGRPVLIGTRTIQDTVRISGLLDRAELGYQLLNGKQDAQEAEIVARAGLPAAVTLATNMAGRGTDIKLTEKVIRLGGLHVIAAEHHTARRVDRQLAGRAARRGEPGSCRFFVSAEDELITRFAPRLSRTLIRRADEVGEVYGDYSAAIRRAQKRAELADYRRRTGLFASDRWRDELLKKL